MKIIGIILIALGLLALVYQGISYTKREKAIDLGGLQVSTQEHKTIPLPPIVGIAACTCGVILLLVNARRT